MKFLSSYNMKVVIQLEELGFGGGGWGWGIIKTFWG